MLFRISEGLTVSCENIARHSDKCFRQAHDVKKAPRSAAISIFDRLKIRQETAAAPCSLMVPNQTRFGANFYGSGFGLGSGFGVYAFGSGFRV